MRIKQVRGSPARAAAHNHHYVTRQRDIERVNAKRAAAALCIGFAAFMAKDIPAGGAVAHHCQQKPFLLRILNLRFTAQFRALNRPARVTIPTPISATKTPGSVMRPLRYRTTTSKLPFDDRRHQRADDK